MMKKLQEEERGKAWETKRTNGQMIIVFHLGFLLEWKSLFSSSSFSLHLLILLSFPYGLVKKKRKRRRELFETRCAVYTRRQDAIHLGPPIRFEVNRTAPRPWVTEHTHTHTYVRTCGQTPNKKKKIVHTRKHIKNGHWSRESLSKRSSVKFARVSKLINTKVKANDYFERIYIYGCCHLHRATNKVLPVVSAVIITNGFRRFSFFLCVYWFVSLFVLSRFLL